MSLPQPTPHRGEDAFDTRWTTWKATAAAQDALWRRRAIVAASAAFLLGGIALGAALYLR